MLAGVFAHEHDELFAVIGPRHARLCPLARDDKDDALLAPRQASIERLALPHNGMQILGIFWIATVRPHDEPLAAIEGENALRGDFANEAEFLHRRPRFAKVRRKRPAEIAWEIAAAEDEQTLDALRIGEAVEHWRGHFHKLPVRRRGQRGSPGETAVIAAGERSEVSRVVHAPGGEHRLSIRHQHRVAMALVVLFCATSNDDMPCRITRDVHGRDGNGAQGARRRPGKGGHVLGMEKRAA